MPLNKETKPQTNSFHTVIQFQVFQSTTNNLQTNVVDL